MRAEIEYGPSYALLVVDLDPGESIRAEPGAMVAQEGVDMQTRGGGGGLFGALRRSMGGESFFMNQFTGLRGGGSVLLAPPTPGDIQVHETLPGEDFFIQSGAFLACTSGVSVDSKFQGFRGFFSGESLFFIRASSEVPGESVFYNSFGAIHQVQVHPGRELVVDTGHLVAFTSQVDYSIGKVGGMRTFIGGGEGLVMKFRGSGSVWVQTRDMVTLADRLAPLVRGIRAKG